MLCILISTQLGGEGVVKHQAQTGFVECVYFLLRKAGHLGFTVFVGTGLTL